MMLTTAIPDNGLQLLYSLQYSSHNIYAVGSAIAATAAAELHVQCNRMIPSLQLSQF